MMRSTFRKFLAPIALTCLGLTSSFGASKPINPALIEELCQVMELEKNAERGVDIMLKQLETQMPQMVEQLKGPADPSDPVKAEKRKKEFREFHDHFMKRYRELLKERIQMGKVIKDIYAPLFGIYFTEEEIQELIKLYKTPLGQRLLSQMPLVMQDAMKRSGEVLNPKIVGIVQQIINEEKERMDAESKAKPAKKE